MGILNVTPDSFFEGSRVQTTSQILDQAARMLEEGAAILDLGGASSRPGAATVGEEEEIARVVPAVEAILRQYPEAILSVDSWRASVAKAAIQAGAAIVNDISGATFDEEMRPLVAALNCPYVLMHMQGTPANMQQNPQYQDVVTEVLDFFIAEIARLRALGVADIILDPGFGFGKTLEHNYTLLRNLHVFTEVTGLPVLAGLSRKSMICKPLRISPSAALNGTTALHMAALQQGAKILRVHDVKEALEVIELHRLLAISQQQQPYSLMSTPA